MKWQPCLLLCTDSMAEATVQTLPVRNCVVCSLSVPPLLLPNYCSPKVGDLACQKREGRIDMHHSTTITLLPVAEITNASNRLICLLQGALIPLITGVLTGSRLSLVRPRTIYTSNTTHRSFDTTNYQGSYRQQA